jgi:hypothetical protein
VDNPCIVDGLRVASAVRYGRPLYVLWTERRSLMRTHSVGRRAVACCCCCCCCELTVITVAVEIIATCGWRSMDVDRRLDGVFALQVVVMATHLTLSKSAHALSCMTSHRQSVCVPRDVSFKCTTGYCETNAVDCLKAYTASELTFCV